MNCPLYKVKETSMFADKENCGNCLNWNGKFCRKEEVLLYDTGDRPR